MSAHHDEATASRRSILGGAVGAGALGLVGAGAGSLPTAGAASAHGTIQTFAAINGARTVYEVNGALPAWGYRPSHNWATSASAHHHFRNVLTYLYDSGHHNHIHIDNLVTGC